MSSRRPGLNVSNLGLTAQEDAEEAAPILSNETCSTRFYFHMILVSNALTFRLFLGPALDGDGG